MASETGDTWSDVLEAPPWQSLAGVTVAGGRMWVVGFEDADQLTRVYSSYQTVSITGRKFSAICLGLSAQRQGFLSTITSFGCSAGSVSAARTSPMSGIRRLKARAKASYKLSRKGRSNSLAPKAGH